MAAIAENVYYPTNFKDVNDAKPFINNMIVVGASTNDNESFEAVLPVQPKKW